MLSKHSISGGAESAEVKPHDTFCCSTGRENATNIRDNTENMESKSMLQRLYIDVFLECISRRNIPRGK